MSTRIDMNTRKLMMAKLQKELSTLFAEQEAGRPKNKLRPLKAQGGITVPGDYRTRQGNPLVDENWLYGTTDNNNMATDPRFGSFSNVPEQSGIGADKGFDWKGLGSNLMQIAPMGANLLSGLGRAEQLKASDYYNPRRNQVASLMRNRRTNVQPQLEQIRGAEANAYRNVRNLAGSRGEMMGNLGGIANTAMRNRASVMANKQNMDLGYQGEEANALMQLGVGEQQANWNTAEWNAQSMANKRNIFRAGLSQLSQYGQNKELMKNQKEQDDKRMLALKDIFGSIAPFMEIFKSLDMSQIKP